MIKEELETLLYNAIILLNDNINDAYDIDSPNFMNFVCDSIGISEQEYRKIMMLE